MITAIDTNILLDVLLRDPTFTASSKEALRRSAPEGAQVICEVVYAELAGLFPTHKELESFLKETGIRLLPSHSDTLWKAGELWKQHCLKNQKERKGSVRRILADFLIGAHALLQAEQFLTRDKDFYRSVFSGTSIDLRRKGDSEARGLLPIGVLLKRSRRQGTAAGPVKERIKRVP